MRNRRVLCNISLPRVLSDSQVHVYRVPLAGSLGVSVLVVVSKSLLSLTARQSGAAVTVATATRDRLQL